MGDHCDLPICRKILQLRRLHEQSQPLEQLDEVIERSGADGQVTRDCQQGEAGQKSSSNSSTEAATVADKEMEQGDNSRNLFGIQEDFNS
jgi:hypothetical protein